MFYNPKIFKQIIKVNLYGEEEIGSSRTAVSLDRTAVSNLRIENTDIDRS